MAEQPICEDCTHGSTSSINYTGHVLSSCSRLWDWVSKQQEIVIDGESLEVNAVAAVARFGLTAHLTDDYKILAKLVASVDLLNRKLAEGETVYGVNTGFGGSADARTNDHEMLQKALIQHHNAAVILPLDKSKSASPLLDGLKKHCLSRPVVRASMLTRCNSLVRGHSAVRTQVIHNMLTLLAHDFTPVVPLRGSISASGDLTPLAYVAGTLEGNPDIFVDCGRDHGHEILPADQALQKAGLQPISFWPKEGLGLLNGTAFSVGAASLVIHEANQLVLFSQVVTAMCTEALLGTRRNFHPFIAQARPHPGQHEAARNMFHFLADSGLVSNSHPESTGLAQDRYALRTSSQWIGPQIENMELASLQIQRELNSTTDNPLLDTASDEVHHCGNFQAASVTSAMEKTMTAMQNIGRMVFSQCSEVLNPMLSKGLPPNLCPDDPSLSFAFKGVDINMASYMSELAYLAHPVSNFVQSAEMHNQGINSLALLAARYAADAVEVLSLMIATYIYVLCQALDLRAMHLEFENLAKEDLHAVTKKALGNIVTEAHLGPISDALWCELMAHWNCHLTCDLAKRADLAVTHSLGKLFSLSKTYVGRWVIDIAPMLQEWQNSVRTMLVKNYNSVRTAFFDDPTTEKYLCSASRQVYVYVRQHLGVPMHRGIMDHPTYPFEKANDNNKKKSIGSQISIVYTVLREGNMSGLLIKCWGQRDTGFFQQLTVDSSTQNLLSSDEYYHSMSPGDKGREGAPTTVSDCLDTSPLPVENGVSCKLSKRRSLGHYVKVGMAKCMRWSSTRINGEKSVPQSHQG
ncbi:aromatic amino acid ammonia-lyase [Aspergillus alliaceus]|uniref:aromatic amino acid ammonia-lyase n=1 Tax=Petromyces alliaceus TaxID=209559 RepID=UPI0012A5B6A2|nr:L-Aspartase-like protein [Aspergillus alliaceus]KAB8226871.1 L-Aspartase-like protein [Aspergillus alliaceus]